MWMLFIYIDCFIIINQLVLWDPPVNYYSISRRQGSTYNPRHSASWHQLSGALCLQLRKVPLPLPLSRHIWKQNCSLLHTTRSNISSAANAYNSNSRHTAPPINVFDIDIVNSSHLLQEPATQTLYMLLHCHFPYLLISWNCVQVPG